MRFEFYSPGHGSDETDGIRAFLPQTDALDASRSWMMRLCSSKTASNAHNLDLPLMMLLWTVTFYHSFCSNDQKQLMRMMIQDQCKKIFEVWSTIDEDWWIWRFLCSWDSWENVMSFDLILESVHSVMIRMCLGIYIIA